MDKRVAYTGTRLSKMAKRGVWVTTPPESSDCLHKQNPSEGDDGCLATLTYCHTA